MTMIAGTVHELLSPMPKRNRHTGLDPWGFPISALDPVPSADNDELLSPLKRKRGPESPRAILLLQKLREMQSKQKPGEVFTLDQIGEFCGVTEKHIEHIEAKALRRLRDIVGQELKEFLKTQP